MPAFQFENNSETIAQRKLQDTMNASPQVNQLKAVQTMADNYTFKTVQLKENNTGLPDNLKTGVEHLSGFSMDDVKVHYNSDKPAQLRAHAYAQGANIHLGPGQEKHLPHEAWHVVQQKQGRVRPTMQLKGTTNINNDPSLENEADRKGVEALNHPHSNHMPVSRKSFSISGSTTTQLKWAGMELETEIPIFKNGGREDKIDGYLTPAGYEHKNVSETLSKMLGKGYEIHVDRREKMPNGTTSLFGAKDPGIMEVVTPPRQDSNTINEDVKHVITFLSGFKEKIIIPGDGWNIGWPTATADFKEQSKDKINEELAADAKATNPLHYDVQITFQNDIETLGEIEVGNALTYAKNSQKGDPIPKIIHLMIDYRQAFSEVIQKIAVDTPKKNADRLAIVATKMFTDAILLFQGSVGTIKNAVIQLFRSDLRNLSGYLIVKENRKQVCETIAGELLKIYSRILPEVIPAENKMKTFLANESDERTLVNQGLHNSTIKSGKDEDETATIASADVIRWWVTEIVNMLAPGNTEVTGPVKGANTLKELQRDKEDEPMVVYEERGGFIINEKDEGSTYGQTMKILDRNYFEKNRFPIKHVEQKAREEEYEVKEKPKAQVEQEKEKEKAQEMALARMMEEEARAKAVSPAETISGFEKKKDLDGLITYLKLPSSKGVKSDILWTFIQPWMEKGENAGPLFKMMMNETEERFAMGENSMKAKFKGDFLTISIE